MVVKAAKSGALKRSGAKSAGKASDARKRSEDPYHHGDLQQALLAAAEIVLERDGLQGLTLRAVAREAGVSHAAPTHHFRDLTGLVSELAAIGFRRFNAAMVRAGSVEGTPTQRSMARAKAYVAYALANREMYGLMFRIERLDMSRPALRDAANASFSGLAGAIAAKRNEQIESHGLSLDQAAEIAKAWSLIHGFTTLVIDGRLQDILNRLPDGDVATLLDAMLKSTIK